LGKGNSKFKSSTGTYIAWWPYTIYSIRPPSDISACEIKGQILFKAEIMAKMGWGHLKILSRTTEPK
jgi:hypothetical protein